MSRSPKRTKAQNRALQQARELLTTLKAGRIPPAIFVLNAVPTIEKLLQSAQAQPEDIGTTAKKLNKLDVTIVHKFIRRWVRQLRKMTLPESPWNPGITTIAELLDQTSRWQGINFTRAKTTPEEVATLVRTARLMLHNRNMRICELNLLKALDVFNDIQASLTEHGLTTADLDYDPVYLASLETLTTFYTEDPTAEDEPDSQP